MQAAQLIQQIDLPQQTLKRLPFCESAKVSRVAEWAGNLRATQAVHTAALLYEALPQVCQLDCSATLRFEILETLRPYVHNCIESLSKHFLNQPISLQEQAQKAAIIAQSLQKCMIDGYTLCVRDIVLDKKQKLLREPFFPVALHRALTAHAALVFRSFQLYSQVPQGIWLSAHSLFRTADQFDLLDKAIEDPFLHKPHQTTIQSAYMRMVLLATSRCFQLGQKDIGALFRAFAEWAQLVRFSVGTSDQKEHFYCVNLSIDQAPMYKYRINADDAGDLIIELDFRSLLSQLTKQSRESSAEFGGSKVSISREISTAALNHVIDTLGNTAQRRQERRETQGTVDICIGLADCHYFLSDCRSFDDFVRSCTRGDSAPTEDAFLSGLTPRDSFSNAGGASATRPQFRVAIQNASQGGYCLMWENKTPIKVESGDLIGVKEFGKKVWIVGVVRWIRQKKTGSQLGVQILSDRALPAAVAQVYDVGGYSDYMRALYLPPSRLLDLPASFITASIPFQELDKVKYLFTGESGEAKLDKCLLSVGSIQQFMFHASANAPSAQPGKESSW